MTQWRVAETLARDVVDQLVRQPASWHQRRADGDLVARVRRRRRRRDQRAGTDPVRHRHGGAAVHLERVDAERRPGARLGRRARVPLLIGINVVYQRRVDRHFDEAQHHLGGSRRAVHESFEGVQLVKAYGAEERETERLTDRRRRPRGARPRRATPLHLRGAARGRSRRSPTSAIVVLGAQRISTGDVTIGELSSIIFMFTLLVFPLRLIGYTLSELPRSMAGWQPGPVGARRADRARPDARSVGRRASRIGVDWVSRSDTPRSGRPCTTRPCTVGGADRWRVVGATGAGKTTLVEWRAGCCP
jgi:ATP-binding cassette, subfamily B, bacterial